MIARPMSMSEEIVSLLSDLGGPFSVPEIVEMLGQPPERVLPSLRSLLAAGVLSGEEVDGYFFVWFEPKAGPGAAADDERCVVSSDGGRR